MVDALFHASGLFAAANSCKNMFLGLLPWDYYLDVSVDKTTGACVVNNFQLLGANSSILLIVLAIVDDLLRIAGLLAVAFVIFSGVQFILSSGSPENAAKARTTGITALVGLAITMVAISFVSFLGNQFASQHAPATKAGLDVSSLPNPVGVANGSIVQTVLTIVFTTIGALSFMIIVIAGFQYVLSQGDPQAAGKAKNTIIYALVGLVIAIAAQSIVSLAVGRP